MHEALGELDAAADAYERAARIKQLRFGNSIGLARVLRLWGSLESRRSRYATAESLLVAARAMRARFPGDSAVELALVDVALATVHRQRGRLTEAVSRHERALGVLSSRLPSDHADISMAEAELGLTLAAAGRRHEAAALLLRARVPLERNPEARHRARLVAEALGRGGT